MHNAVSRDKSAQTLNLLSYLNEAVCAGHSKER